MTRSRASATLALLQFADSQFPAGTFAHSYGLEQLVRDGRVTDSPSLRSAVRSVLVLQVAESEARAAARAVATFSRGNVGRLCAVDAALFRTKAAEELRAASSATGSRLLQEVVAHERDPLLLEYAAEVQAGRAPGTHPVVFGAVGATFGVGAEDVAAALLFGTATVLLSAGMRLLPVSHRDVQGALHWLRPRIAELAAAAVRENDRPFASCHPLQEIASMRHRDAPVRFFTS
ncbi:MAG: urease accessory protein UreF [Dehalococcoidia bacterium]